MPGEALDSSFDAPPPIPPTDRRKVAIVLGVIALFVVVAGLATRPVWRSIKARRAAQFAAQAEQALESRSWQIAFERARAALNLAPLSPAALRVAAVALAQRNDPVALSYFDLLLSLPAATVPDRERYVDFALRLGDTNVARVHLDLLLAPTNPSPRSLTLAARYETLAGDTRRATRLARQAFQADPANPDVVMALASALVNGTRRTERDEARAALWPFALTNGPFQIEALGRILASSDPPRHEREQILAILAAIPQRTFEQQVLWYDARLSIEPTRGRDFVREMIGQLRPESDRDLALFTRWLIRRGFAAEAASLLAGERVFRNGELFLSRYLALLELGDSRKAYDMLFIPGAPLDLYALDDLRCRAALAMKAKRPTRDHLLSAVDHCGTDVRRIAAVDELARLCGQPSAAIPAWERLLRNPRLRPMAFRQLLSLSEAAGDTLGAREYARQLARLEPENPRHRLAIAHADLLLGENLDAVFAETQARLAARPDDPEVRILAAFAHLRRGQPEGARTILQGAVVPLDEVSPGMLAIVAAAFAANGDMEKAAELLQRIPITSLRPEERELLRPVLVRDSPLVSGGGRR